MIRIYCLLYYYKGRKIFIFRVYSAVRYRYPKNTSEWQVRSVVRKTTRSWDDKVIKHARGASQYTLSRGHMIISTNKCPEMEISTVHHEPVLTKILNDLRRLSPKYVYLVEIQYFFQSVNVLQMLSLRYWTNLDK